MKRHAVIVLIIFFLMSVAAPVLAGADNTRFFWLGNSYPGGDGKGGTGPHVLHDVSSMYVSPDGKVYTNVYWEESGWNFTEITDGQVTNAGMGSHGWGYEGGFAVTANSKYVYFGQSASYQSARDGNTNWPPKNYAWFGVTRRRVDNIKTGDDFPGMKSADKNEYRSWFLPIVELSVDNKSEGLTGDVSGSGECVIAGLAATETELYVSDRHNNKIRVYDADSMAFKYDWNFTNPGQMTIDSYGHLWVVQNDNYILCYDPVGRMLLRYIELKGNSKVWSIAATKDGRLLVPDRGPSEQILIYNRLNTQGSAPLLESRIGAAGGIFSGVGTEIGRVRNQHFYQISGVGVDADNNIYVCNSGNFVPGGNTSQGTTFIESYTENGSLRWRLHGLQFLDNAAAEPNNYSSVYSKAERFEMNPAADNLDAGPENGFEYVGYTINPHKYPDDFRLQTNNLHVVAVRTIEGMKLLFLTDMYGYSLYVYRFSPETDGETAIPVMAIHDDAKLQKVRFMHDTDGDGKLDFEAEIRSKDNRYFHPWTGWFADTNGNIWNARTSAPTNSDVATTSDSVIAVIWFEGLNGNGMPVWSHDRLKDTESAPAPFDGTKGALNEYEFKDLRMSHYDAENDVMYLTGALELYENRQMRANYKSSGDTLARYDNWSTGNRTPTYAIKIDRNKDLYQGKYLNLNAGFAVCGGYIFVGESAFTEKNKNRAIHIYKAETGVKVDRIIYDQSLGEIGLWDIVMPFTVVELPHNRYMVMIEDDLLSKTLIAEWQAPQPYKFSVPDYSKIKTENKVEVSVKREMDGYAANLIFALYNIKEDGRELVDVQFKDISGLALGIAVNQTAQFEKAVRPGQEIRVFAWDENLRTLKKVESYVIP